MTKPDLETLSSLSLQEVNINSLHELTDIIIEADVSIEDRLAMYIEQISNPYCFKVNGTPVKIAFANHNRVLNEALYNYLTDVRNAQANEI